MKREIKPIWKDIKELDAEIRTIEHIKEKEDNYFIVEIDLFNSLGEQGEILSLNYDNNPAEEEIIKDIKEHLEFMREDLDRCALSSREEKYLKILNKLVTK